MGKKNKETGSQANNLASSKRPQQKSILKKSSGKKDDLAQQCANTATATEKHDLSDEEYVEPPSEKSKEIDQQIIPGENNFQRVKLQEFTKLKVPDIIQEKIQFSQSEVLGEEQRIAGQPNPKGVGFLDDEAYQMNEKVQQYLKDLLGTKRIDVLSKDACHNILLQNLSAKRLNELKAVLKCTYYFILRVNTTRCQENPPKCPDLQQIFFDIVPFKIQKQSKPKKNNLQNNQPKKEKKMSEEQKESAKQRIYAEELAKKSKEEAQSLPQPVVVSLAELIHLKKFNNQKEFFSTFFSDIMTASAAAYYFHKDRVNFDYRIRFLFKMLEEQIKKKEIRDSDTTMAEEIFSKKKLYDALNQANEYLLDQSNFRQFVHSKYDLEASEQDVKKMLEGVAIIESQSIMRVNQESLDTLVMPLFRMPYKVWNQFYGGLDIYNKLILDMKSRRKNQRRYSQFKNKKKLLINQAKNDQNSKAQNQELQQNNELEEQVEQRSDDSYQALQTKIYSEQNSQNLYSQYSQSSFGDASEISAYIQMQTNSLKQLQDYGIQVKNNADIEQIIFNTNYSILDYGKINPDVQLHIKKIVEHKGMPHYFSYSPSQFKQYEEDFDEPVIDFKRARMMKNISVLPTRAFKERGIPKVLGCNYSNAQPEQITYHQKAYTKYGGSIGGSALQSIGAMYNYLADFVVFQDQAFLLQTLCLMLQKSCNEVENLLQEKIDLSQFYTFDNDWKFYHFEKFAAIEKVDVKPKQYQAHILGHIANLKEVQIFHDIALTMQKGQILAPGPWVISVDYKARGKLKTHFVVVKAEIVDDGDAQVPVFYCNHPSKVFLKGNSNEIDHTGVYQPIAKYFIKDDINIHGIFLAEDQDKEQEYTNKGLFQNPLQDLFGYYAKHNQGQSLEASADDSKKDGGDKQSNIQTAKYENMRIFRLSKVVEQDEIKFIAIQQLFFYFQRAQEMNQKSISEKAEIMEQCLMSFAYNCDYIHVKDLSPQVIKEMGRILMTENGQLKDNSKLQAEQTMMKIFKMGYTIADFENQGSEVIAIRDKLAELLHNVNLQAQGSHGFECSNPSKLINAYVICKKKLEGCIYFIKKNHAFSKQRQNELDSFELLLGEDLLKNSKDSLLKTVYLSHNVYLFMVLTIRWILLKLSDNYLKPSQITYQGMKSEFLKSQREPDQAIIVKLSIPSDKTDKYLRHSYKLGSLYCLDATALEIDKIRKMKMHSNIFNQKQEEIVNKLTKKQQQEMKQKLAQIFLPEQFEENNGGSQKKDKEESSEKDSSKKDKEESSEKDSSKKDKEESSEKEVEEIKQSSQQQVEENQGDLQDKVDKIVIEGNDYFDNYINIESKETQFLTEDQARAKWLLFGQKWVPEQINFNEAELQEIFPYDENNVVEELIEKIFYMKMKENENPKTQSQRSRSREIDKKRMKKQTKISQSPQHKIRHKRSQSRERRNHKRDKKYRRHNKSESRSDSDENESSSR